MKACVFAGTFDPFSIGHKDIVSKCLEIFDKVYVVIGENKDKTTFFTSDERLDIVRKVFEGDDRVEVCRAKGLLIDFMKKKGVRFNVRGIRNVEDYKYETLMTDFNEDFYPEIITVYLPTDKKYNYVSSTAVRNLIGLDADFSRYVPENVYERIKDITDKKREQKADRR